MPAALRILIGLITGFTFGLAISATDLPWLSTAGRLIEPVGTIFINAIRMTVVPLVVSKLIVAVTGTDQHAVRRVGAGAIALFFALLIVATTFSATVAPPLLAGFDIDAPVTSTLRASAGTSEPTPAAPLTFRDWLVGLVSTNPVRAAADGAMLPLIVFAVALGLALAHVETARRQTMVQFFQAVADAMLVLVRWILVVAPIGVFALAVPLAARLGLAAAGALAYYIALVATVCIAFALLVLYPLAVIGGRVSLWRFARAAAPAQAIAFSSRSSLASLPAMIEEARAQLRLPDEVVSFFLPLAASMFRLGTGMAMIVAVVFLARLYAVPLDTTDIATVAFTAALTTFGSPGVPSGSILVIVPVLEAARIPVDGIGVLLAIDTIPDMIRTTTNITADMAVASLLGRRSTPLE